ncbi:uncharacterized protein LOC132744887 isoform X2 [Ruditapes philippinarum]|uniref:uncharacterized protein LOC132744887 isoform X2 n=1 Tax=Ruditapes philippinarum TaxID=129788 RepID=UPI00295B7BE6|nr:uncharacterized protein LOC132744887 isoform X2 [Ruditapes philippinarum]
MTSQFNDRVKVQLKVFKPLDCYPGGANDYFVAVVGSAIQLGNYNTKMAPRCNQVGRNFWCKDIWMPKNSTVQYKFLVVRACTGDVTDIESIQSHTIYVGQKPIIVEHTYNEKAFDGKEVDSSSTVTRERESFHKPHRSVSLHTDNKDHASLNEQRYTRQLNNKGNLRTVKKAKDKDVSSETETNIQEDWYTTKEDKTDLTAKEDITDLTTKIDKTDLHTGVLQIMTAGMVSHPERETDTREDSLPMTTESIEKDITEIVAEDIALRSSGASMKEDCKENASLTDTRDVNLYQEDVTNTSETVVQNMTANNIDITMTYQNATFSIERCTEHTNFNVSLISRSDVTNTHTVTDPSMKDSTDTGRVNMPEEIETDLATSKNITNALPEQNIPDMETQNADKSLKGDHSGYNFNINCRNVAVVAAGITVVSCIGYYVFFRK